MADINSRIDSGIDLRGRSDSGRLDIGAPASTSRALLTISVDPTASRPVVSLAGELDIATAPAVKTVCFETFESRPRPYVVVDLAGLYFCDCAGLNAFVLIHNWARAGGGWIRLCRTDRRLQKMLDITGLAAALRCYPTAVDAFADVE
ncbi:STAS domain-containing protein [Catenulispora sp. NF23]|uniref:Anti-sigma factor antagonist n=1 Tax=Catenulispora pinistramenti TaxID=2705254 RepID=A0ABS5KHL8_9ACTN|nr:STAS domain-containing protein [Catenulispora pinistramenti]MBS2533637.1 STAS domain-containing protein [Catenulispora pinistramenti]MBS2545853.1 STAS domain-containing protein [Catenulispora pinistramenti]